MDWQTVLAAFIGAVLGAVGTEFGKRLFEPSSRFEARRDTIRAQMFDKIQKVKADALVYWSGGLEEDHRIVEALLKSDLHSLNKDACELFFGDSSAMDKTIEEVSLLRQACTGGTFGDGPPNAEPDRIEEIKIAADQLERGIALRRHQQSRPLWGKRH